MKTTKEERRLAWVKRAHRASRRRLAEHEGKPIPIVVKIRNSEQVKIKLRRKAGPPDGPR